VLIENLETDNTIFSGFSLRNMSVEVRAAEGDNAAAVVMSVSSEEPVLTPFFLTIAISKFTKY